MKRYRVYFYEYHGPHLPTEHHMLVEADTATEARDMCRIGFGRTHRRCAMRIMAVNVNDLYHREKYIRWSDRLRHNRGRGCILEDDGFYRRTLWPETEKGS